MKRPPVPATGADGGERDNLAWDTDGELGRVELGMSCRETEIKLSVERGDIPATWFWTNQNRAENRGGGSWQEFGSILTQN